jgi:hypothetical protein
MAVRQQQAIGTATQPTTSPPIEMHAPGPSSLAEEPSWLWESLRYKFWRPIDLARGIQYAGPFTVEQGETIAYWWSLLAKVEGLWPKAYAAAFVRATEQHDSDQVRWSLLAMLRDALHHEQLYRLAVERLAPGWPRQGARQSSIRREASQHLREVDERVQCCWDGYQSALAHQGIGVISGALLLGTLVTGSLYEHWATACVTPALATAFRHLARDDQRHQAVLRALATRDWPSLSFEQRSQAAAQVRATIQLVSTIALDPVAGPPEAPGDQATSQRPRWLGACVGGLGVPTAGQRQELLRAALLQVKNLQDRYGIPFPALPALAIPGSREVPAGLR